jgi:hypothetical protein
MGVWTYEQYRTRQQKTEVKALIALAQFGNKPQQWTACAKLEKIAYPEKEAKKVYHDQEQETL